MKTIQVEYPLKTSLKLASEPCVIALGFFDGVHLGHQEIIKTAKAEAEQKGLKLAVMTFSPHPSVVIKKGKQIDKYLTPVAEKARIFNKLGVDLLYVVDFTEEVAGIAPGDFIENYICGLKCRHAVAGFDYTYGFRGKGNMTEMKKEADGRFDVTVVEKKEKHCQKISSTLLRELISAGEVERVPDYLGKNYEVKGKIKRIKNKLTIDISADYMLPCCGNYEITIQSDRFHTKALCEINKYENYGKLNIHSDTSSFFKEGSEVNVKWENFISDFERYFLQYEQPYEEFSVSI